MPPLLRRLDPLAGVSAAVALLVYLPHGFDGELTRDLGVYSYAGQQFAEGVPPYGAILNRAGPLAHLIPGIGAFLARSVGVDDVLGMRVLFLVIAVACVVVAYLLGRDMFRSRPAGLATAAALLCFHGFITYATYGPREKTPMVLFVLLALLAMVHQRWATTGCFIALATLTWQPAFLAALAAAVVAVLLGLHERRIRALARIAVGGVVTLVAAVAVVGDLRLFLDDFLLINARYTHQISLLDFPDDLWELMRDAYGWSLWVFLIGAAAQFVLAVAALAGRDRRDPRHAAMVGTTILFGVGAAWSLKAFNGWPDAFFMLPASALGIGGLVALAARVHARAALALSLAWVTVAVGLSLAFSISTRDDTLDEQRADVAAVLALLPADARMLSVEAPQPLVLAHERNLSEFQLFGNGLIDYVDDTWPGGRFGYGQWITDQAPTVIAFGGSTPPRWLAPTLDDAYQEVGSSPGWVWYARTDMPVGTLDRLMGALAATS